MEDNIAKVTRIDRAWLLLEADLRNVINHTTRRTLARALAIYCHPLLWKKVVIIG